MISFIIHEYISEFLCCCVGGFSAFAVSLVSSFMSTAASEYGSLEHAYFILARQTVSRSFGFEVHCHSRNIECWESDQFYAKASSLREPA